MLKRSCTVFTKSKRISNEILLVVSPTAKWTAQSVSNSNEITTQMAMWIRIAIFHKEIYTDGFYLNK